MVAGALATKWEALPRVRNRFSNGEAWVKFAPLLDEKQDATAVAVGLNAPALLCMAEHFQVHGGKKIRIKKLQKEVSLLCSGKCLVHSFFNFRSSQMALGIRGYQALRTR